MGVTCSDYKARAAARRVLISLSLPFYFFVLSLSPFFVLRPAMACHEELIEEMPRLEKMSNAARLKLAKKRRQKQLKRYTETERNRPHASGKKRTECKINFEDEALLHDAVQQNNVEEGEL